MNRKLQMFEFINVDATSKLSNFHFIPDGVLGLPEHDLGTAGWR